MVDNEKQLPLTNRRIVIPQTPSPTTDAARQTDLAENLKRHKTFMMNYDRRNMYRRPSPARKGASDKKNPAK